MEKGQWVPKEDQAVTMEFEKGDEVVEDGINKHHLENGNENTEAEVTGNMKDNVERNSQIQQAVEASVSEMSKKTVDSILDQVKSLSPKEHLLLYLKLPTECSNVGDPLRQPLNPLGSRSEISQTIMWIKTHLEEDPELSLPKQDVYNDYYAFCGPNKVKPLSTADFGKVMKQVYPRVRPRRLGTRGNSRYCYAGLRRRLKLTSPLLPDLSDKPQSSEVSCSSTDLVTAAWTIVREWSENQLGTQFPSLQALACYLVLNLSIGNGSHAANLIATVVNSPFKGDAVTSSFCNNKHRETQLQLQRKIHQKNEINREQKRKMQLQSPKVEQKVRSKKCKLQGLSTSSSLSTSPITQLGDINTSPSQGLQPVCDKTINFTNLQTLPDFSSFQKTVTTEDVCEYTNEMYKESNGESRSDFVPKPNVIGKLPIPRLNNNANKFPSLSSPKRAKSAKYKTIQPKPEPCDIGVYNPQHNTTAVDFRSQQNNYIKCERKPKSTKFPQDAFKTEMVESNITSIAVDGTDMSLPRERLISIGDIDKSALDDYLCSNNSQEHEEELVKLFENKDKTSEQDITSKLSQLRQLLITQQNMNLDLNQQINTEVDVGNNGHPTGLNLSSLLSSNISAFTKTNLKHNPGILNLNAINQRTSDISNYSSNSHGNARRRVSFETVHHEDAVPPSPNTRRKNFNFTPISPGPLSPNGRQSKCSSTTVSPFVSPRNTPVPRSKGNVHNSYVVNQSHAPVGLSSRKPINSPKTSIRIKQETDTHNDTDNAINQINDCHEIRRQLMISTDMANCLPMSAPASPKLPLKSVKQSNLLHKLLNSNNKVTYSPNYTRSQSSSGRPQDPLSSEICQLFSNDLSQLSLEVGYRSQSVPLHQMSIKSDEAIHSPLAQNSFTQFPFMGAPINNTLNHSPPVQNNEFNDFDAFSTTENINMTKILSTLDNCPSDVIQNTNRVMPGTAKVRPSKICTDFSAAANIGMPLEKNLELSINEDAFDNGPHPGFNQQSLSTRSFNILPGLRGLNRSQSIDIDLTNSDMNYPLKYNPSRSVPGTPVPFINTKACASKNYRSYPSTPLINETFSYNHGQDYLLNGQPIKEKIGVNVEINENLQFFQNSESNDEIYNVDMFSVNDTNLNCDILMSENKNNFAFDGQLSENNYCHKQNINCALDENCVTNGNEFDFKHEPHTNGS